MSADLAYLEDEDIIKVVVQNDVFDVFTHSKVCYRFDLATALLIQEISFDFKGVGDPITDVLYFDKADAYVIVSAQNFIVGNFAYGFTLVKASAYSLDIQREYLAYATADGITVLHYPQLKVDKRIELKGVRSFCFVNDDSELVIVTDGGNFILSYESMIMEPLKQLSCCYDELRYKNDYILGIKKEGVNFIEEDILAPGTGYPTIAFSDQEITAVKLSDDELYIIVGGSRGGVKIFNLENNEVFYEGNLVDGCAVLTIHMDMEYQSVFMYTQEKGIEIHPFIDFI